MLRKIFSTQNIIKRFNCMYMGLESRGKSALYITPNKTTNTYPVVTPYLDLEERLYDIDRLEKNLKYRGYPAQVRNLANFLTMLKEVENEVNIAEITRREISKRLNHLMEDPEANEKDINKLKTPAAVSKQEFKQIKEHFKGIEEVFAMKILNLPNVLHESTPFHEPELIYSYLNMPTFKEEENQEQKQGHLEILKKLNLIEYSNLNPYDVYLKNDAASFELNVLNYLKNKLQNELKFTQFSNCDFARSVVVEGCGVNFKSRFNTFTLLADGENKDNKLAKDHFVGGASLFAFMAYFTKHFIQVGYLPLKLFCSGRQHKPTENKDDIFPSLLNPTQSSALQIFVALKDNDAIEDELLNQLSGFLKEFYKTFGVHFRINKLSCNKLQDSESLRLSVQMFSPSKDMYIEVGNVSAYEKYLSKRLLFTYSDNEEQQFLRVISGTLINVHKVLGCLVENKEKFVIPDVFKNY